MDILEISKKITEKIAELESVRSEIDRLAKDMAQKSGDYDKLLAKYIIKLKNGEEFDLMGDKIINPPVSIIEKVAKGLCYEKKIELETAEALYKNALKKMDAIQGEMNGYQSIYKHMESA